MRHIPAKILALPAAIVVAFAAGCGGAGSSTSSAPVATATTTATATTAATPTTAQKTATHASAAPKPSTSRKRPAPPPSVHQGASAFLRPGDNAQNSLQATGSEATGGEFQQAAAALHGYLDARAAGDWTEACSYLANGVASALAGIAGQGAAASPPKGAKLSATAREAMEKVRHMGCPEILARMSSMIVAMPARLKREYRQADVRSMRLQGAGRAFLLFRGAQHTNYFMQMVKEGGQWKVANLEFSPLP